MPRNPSWALPAAIIVLAAPLGQAAAGPPADTKPFGGKPVTIPGTVEAEHFDLGGEGTAYHDLDDANQGVASREPTGVDIEQRSARAEPGSQVADPPAAKALRLAEGMADPLSPAEALATMETLPGLRVELVAAEPLVADPVAIDWGADGSLWVAEMADYPLGIDPPPGANQKGRPGGRVRRLVDTDGDGIPDSGTVFLAGIPFPTGVMAWRDGVIVTSAPTVFFARDTTGDGRSDERIDLFTGFKEGNQQHRINGLRWGLDGWCWLANGDSGGRVRSLATGREIDLGNRDLRVRPETGELELVAGMSQFGRARDDWSHWFGCNNSDPCFLLGPDDPALARNRFVQAPAARHQLVDPGQRLFPSSPTVARFNYPGSANHFTSACGLEICRDPLLGPDFAASLVVCEPVHNLVHREALERDGWGFRSRRLDRETHLLRSSDNWFRPVLARTGPDGCLWVVDMYRAVVEHPEWIPPEIQERIDLRAGDDLGRIWRLVPAGGRGRAVPRLDRLSPADLVAVLSSPNGTLRDLAQRTVIERCTPATATAAAAARAPDAGTVAEFTELLGQAAAAADEPVTRATAVWTLALIGRLDESTLLRALDDSDPRVQAQAVAVSRLDRA
ncbi:MAG: PVC-type heme-binding CxxCH protein, partial [Planctomycetia bacterium]